jgi:hypothetical protein
MATKKKSELAKWGEALRKVANTEVKGFGKAIADEAKGWGNAFVGNKPKRR